jgi:hypothetical protein
MQWKDQWQSWQQQGHPLPYLLIDAAGFEGGWDEVPQQPWQMAESLFLGDLAIELRDVAPYLVQVKDWSEETLAVVQDLVQRQLALVLTLMPPPKDEDGAPPMSFAQLHRHLRRFSVVYGEGGKPLYFRFYDARLLPEVIEFMQPAQRADFMKPLSSVVGSEVKDVCYAWMAGNPNEVVCPA